MSKEPSPIHNGLTRIKIYTIKEIFKYIKSNKTNAYMLDGEYNIRMYRAKVFYTKGIRNRPNS